MHDKGAMTRAEDTTVTFLEMTAAPARRTMAKPPGKLSLQRAEDPPLHLYPYLYEAIGRDYTWVIRARMSDEELSAILTHPDLELYLFYINGVPAGFAELDFADLTSESHVAHLAYFGLMPEFLGKGYGRFFLGQTLDILWARSPEKILLNTCSHDHPAALHLYQRAGFVAYARETQQLMIPDDWDT